MRTPEQVTWDFVHQWLEKAQKDLEAAKTLLKGEFEDYDNVGFHAQQAAEKFLKVLLVRHQIEFPKTHNVALLRQLAAKVDRSLSESLKEADALTPYGVEFRYPGDLSSVSHKEGLHALRLAEKVRDVVLSLLKPYLEVGRP